MPLIGWQGKVPNSTIGVRLLSVGFEFVTLMNLKIAQSMDFSQPIQTDSTDAFLANEEAVREMGMKNPTANGCRPGPRKGISLGY